jgi:hypothetical protein
VVDVRMHVHDLAFLRLRLHVLRTVHDGQHEQEREGCQQHVAKPQT